MRTLSYKDKFRVTATDKGTWSGVPYDATVYTLPGYCADLGPEYIAACIARGENLVDSISRPNSICSDVHRMRAENAEWDAAPVFQNGESVLVDGKEYRIHVRGRYSNPVAFVPVN
jgi:hypothetical protein